MPHQGTLGVSLVDSVGEHAAVIVAVVVDSLQPHSFVAASYRPSCLAGCTAFFGLLVASTLQCACNRLAIALAVVVVKVSEGGHMSPFPLTDTVQTVLLDSPSHLGHPYPSQRVDRPCRTYYPLVIGMSDIVAVAVA